MGVGKMVGGIRLGSVALFFAVMLFVAGCGGGGSSETKSSTPPGTLNIALESEPPELDPYLSSAYVDRQVMASIYDKLVDIDENGEVQPMLAESFEVSDDGTEYTFELRDGVKFHDGEPFDAEAVKFNLDRYMEKDSTRSTEVAAIDSVEVEDDMTVKVTLKEPYAPFITVLADRAGIIASPKAIEENDGRISDNPIGTGPFKFVERRKGESITVEKNEDYWKDGLPKVDKIVYKGIDDANVQLQNFRSGELDIIDSIPFVEFKNLQEGGDYVVSNEPGLGYIGIWLNVTQPPFEDKALRQALYQLVDREAIVKAVLRDVGGSPANSPFGKESFAYDEKTDAFEKPSVSEAKKLLEEAGKPDGFSFTLKIDPSPESQQLGQIVQNNFKKAGIEVKLERLEFGTLLEDSDGGDFEALLLGWSGRVDPELNIGPFHETDGDFNDSGYSNPEVDDLLVEARRTSDEAERKKLYGQVVEILHEDVPYLYLFHNNQTTDVAFQGNIKGFKAYPDGILRPATFSKK
ncbi:MAG: ABC transporter substrate-binding protein [Rubrobacteraceae bacterium]